MEHDKQPSVTLVVKKLIAEDGWKGLYRGLGPRFLSMSAWGTSMILAYEYLSMLSFHLEFHLFLKEYKNMNKNINDLCFDM